MIKILIIDPANFIGGAELFTIDLVNNLAQRYPDIQIDIAYNGNPDYLKLLPPNTQTFILPFPKLSDKYLTAIWDIYQSARNLRKIIRKSNYDYVQTNSVRAHITGSIAIRKTKSRLIWFLHDFTAPRILTKLFATYPSIVFCCSESIKDFAIQKISTKLSAKISILPNGIDFNKLPHPRPITTIHKIGIIGRIDPWKGQKYFLQAALEILTKYPDLEFQIIGSPCQYDLKTIRYFTELQTLIRNTRTKNIKLIGFVKNIYETINTLDLVVHASTEPEPFGRVIIEAMSLSKPVIATNLGGPKKIINSPINGLLIHAKDSHLLAQKIISLVKNPQKAITMGKKARETVLEKYNLDKIIDHYQHKIKFSSL